MLISFETKSHMRHENFSLNNQNFSKNMKNYFYIEKTKKGGGFI